MNNCSECGNLTMYSTCNKCAIERARKELDGSDLTQRLENALRGSLGVKLASDLSAIADKYMQGCDVNTRLALCGVIVGWGLTFPISCGVTLASVELAAQESLKIGRQMLEEQLGITNPVPPDTIPAPKKEEAN